jgi:hypothetical protein
MYAKGEGVPQARRRSGTALPPTRVLRWRKPVSAHCTKTAKACCATITRRSSSLAVKQGDALGKAGLDRLISSAANGLDQSRELDEIKRKIFDAHTAQQTFGGLKYCSELNGGASGK